MDASLFRLELVSRLSACDSAFLSDRLSAHLTDYISSSLSVRFSLVILPVSLSYFLCYGLPFFLPVCPSFFSPPACLNNVI